MIPKTETKLTLQFREYNKDFARQIPVFSIDYQPTNWRDFALSTFTMCYEAIRYTSCRICYDTMNDPLFLRKSYACRTRPRDDCPLQTSIPVKDKLGFCGPECRYRWDRRHERLQNKMREYEPEFTESYEGHNPKSPLYEDLRYVWDGEMTSGLRDRGGKRKRCVLRRVYVFFAYPI